MSDKMREAFETAIVQVAEKRQYRYMDSVLERDTLGDYATTWVDSAWIGYQIALTQQPESEPAAAIEAAAQWVEARRDAYIEEHGSYDPDTGATEFPGDGEEYVGELGDIAEGIRSLRPQPSAQVPGALLLQELNDECEQLQREIDRLKSQPTPQVPDWQSEAKRAFWAGLEIGAGMGAVSIQPRWDEYINKRLGDLAAAPSIAEKREPKS